jgi:predicted RNA binding protein YcfA (HicA-like mRNA interferase family)
MDISEGKKHTKIKLGGRRSLVGRHPGDLKTGTVQGILKQLGVTAKDIEQ